MGKHKQQLIADQVELGDRIPAPKPARHHVAVRDVKRRDLRAKRLQAKVALRQHAIDFIVAYMLGVGTVVTMVLLVWLLA